MKRILHRYDVQLNRLSFLILTKIIRNLVENCNSSGIPIHSNIIREKAYELVKASGQIEFKNQ